VTAEDPDGKKEYEERNDREGDLEKTHRFAARFPDPC
jgi:hypothetical protein